jgi:hypothetical protein
MKRFGEGGKVIEVFGLLICGRWLHRSKEDFPGVGIFDGSAWRIPLNVDAFTGSERAFDDTVFAGAGCWGRLCVRRILGSVAGFCRGRRRLFFRRGLLLPVGLVLILFLWWWSGLVRFVVVCCGRRGWFSSTCCCCR